MGQFVKAMPPEIVMRARTRLLQIHHALRVDDLRLPPSNRLERLVGDREGQWSIRINKQWRICFLFIEKDAFDVEIIDYH